MTAATFKAAMIQMRSGLSPAANIDAAARMIGEAKSAGADYVLTPEMTNIMAVKRERLFVVHDNVFFNQHGDVICSGRGQTIRPM